MTEEEARTKWCPFARTLYMPKPSKTSIPLGPQNRTMWHDKDDPDTIISRCIGSQCMMWRWANPATEIAPRFGEHGHCGLAK